MIQKGRPLSLHVSENATHIQKPKVYFFLISDSKPIARSSSYKVNEPDLRQVQWPILMTDKIKQGILYWIGNLQPF